MNAFATPVSSKQKIAIRVLEENKIVSNVLETWDNDDLLSRDDALRIIYAIVFYEVYLTDDEEREMQAELWGTGYQREGLLNMFPQIQFQDMDEVPDHELYRVGSLIRGQFLNGRMDSEGNCYLALKEPLTWEEAVALCARICQDDYLIFDTDDFASRVPGFLEIPSTAQGRKNDILAYDFFEMIYYTVHIPRFINAYGGPIISYLIDSR